MKVRTPFTKKTKSLNRIEISRKNIMHNFALCQALVPGKHVCPVLKSNAYGHGIKQIVEILKDEDFPFFVVDSYHEALQVREVSHKKQVLIMGYTHPENYASFDFRSLVITVYDLKTIHALGKLNKKIRLHLMVNTGMNREGIRLEEIKEYVDAIRLYEHLSIDGVFSHFADADNGAADNTYTEKQMKVFSTALDMLEAEGESPPHVHISNSAGIMKSADPRITMCRLGLGLYGYHTLAQGDASLAYIKELRPALRFLATVTNIVKLQEREQVSYNCTYTAEKEMTIGVASVGYYECLNRLLSNKGVFMYRDNYLPIVGRVCMNMTCFDIHGQDINIGDEIEIISSDAEDRNSIYALAETCQTIPYEVLVNISESTRRVVV